MPTPDGWRLARRAELLAIEIEVQGMIALNAERAVQGYAQAYAFDAFFAKAEEARAIAELIEREDP